ncbi:MAG: AAA family ATPase [Myxococcales bacterium]|nr:AAA family ATPase [Myxococcales bacterium]
MAKAIELSKKQLRTRCSPRALGFKSTAELTQSSAAVGQDRAVDALSLGLAIKRGGFNVFILGPTGSGRSKVAKALIEATAKDEPVADDICYVYNFELPRKPRALRLPPGQGARLRDHMERLIDELKAAIPAAFASQSYRERKEAVERELGEQHEAEVEAVAAAARALGVAVVRTPAGFALAPMREGKVLDGDEQAALGDEEKKALEKKAETIHEKLREAMKRVPLLQREQRERIKRLDQEVTRDTVGDLFGEIKRAFGSLPAVLAHIAAVERDIVDKTADLIRVQAEAEGENPMALAMAMDGGGVREGPILRRYRINLLVDRGLDSGAPVVCVDHPTTAQLVGKVEHISQLGVLITDFNLIKPGALHEANGGYLLIDARRLLMQPVAYEQLKRTLRAGEIRVESVAEALDLAQTVSQEPEPIAFAGKVVLVGERDLYYRLSALDPEFDELFKIAAEFESTMERTPEACKRFAALLARVLEQEQMLPMEANAVATVIDEASRLAGDARKISMHVRTLFDVVREADHWARAASRERIGRRDVERALGERRRRHGRLYELTLEAIDRGAIHIDTAGAAVGQINALSVVDAGQARFGFPSRLSARARLGKGEVIAIDREVQMGGKIHNKGVMILSSFLGSRYMQRVPSSLHATLVFEQMYGFVEGDSASLAELLVLLSAIGELPLRQGIAITGSVDQHGRVQAIGGINEKIEGFFDVCRARGLDGTQGVVMPSDNISHLMLREDVVAAVGAGRFHVYGVRDVDAAAEVLFGLEAGARDLEGRYPEGSINGRVEARLEAMRADAIAAARAASEEDEREGGRDGGPLVVPGE